MADSEYVTKEMLELREKNLTLTFTAQVGEMLDTKFNALEERLDEGNITRRNQVIEEVTGFPYEDRAEIKKTLQHAHSDMVASEDTRGKIKTVLITWGVPASIVVAIDWFIRQAPGGN